MDLILYGKPTPQFFPRIVDNLFVSASPSSDPLGKLIRPSANDVRRVTKQERWVVLDLRQEQHCRLEGSESCEVVHHPYLDHEAVPLTQLVATAFTLANLLTKGNSVLVYCKNGKGRTGLVVCAYLVLFQDMSATQANSVFGARRRLFRSCGVTIPSQLRYLGYIQSLYRRELLGRYEKMAGAECFVKTIEVCVDPRFARTWDTLKLGVYAYAGDRGLVCLAHNSATNVGSDVVSLQVGLRTSFPDLKIGLSFYRGSVLTSVNGLWLNCIAEHLLSESFRVEGSDIDGFKGSRHRGAAIVKSIGVDVSILFD